MSAVNVLDGVYWVGAVDKNLKYFHGRTYQTKRGTTYNAYMIKDEKTALVDTVYAPFAGRMMENIKEVAEPSSIDYIIANHAETDHSGALVELLKVCPKAKIIGTAKCRETLYKNYYSRWDFQTVKTGDKLKLGKKTLVFVEAPMLHWPDSMFTHVAEDCLLLSNDAFGQHFASDERFADEVDQNDLMDEAAAYYANILWTFSPLVKKKIEQLQQMNMPIKMIAPSHGLIWRTDPMKIVEAYLSWAKNETGRKAVVVYETMWRSTKKMAEEIQRGIKGAGVEAELVDIVEAGTTEAFKQMLDAKAFVVGSSTHDGDMLPGIAAFLHLLKGFKPKNRIGCAFGSFGWTGGATAAIERSLKEAGVEVGQPALGVKFVPDDAETGKCYEFGRQLANKVKKQEQKCGQI